MPDARDNGHAPPADDDAALRGMGYAQQLLRDVGGFQNFALSFSVISILTGAVTLYGHGLSWGGPRVMSLGWALVTVMTLAVAASMAQLASSFPTAGALYHWSSVLGSRGWGFLTAWLNTLGQVAVTAGVDYGLCEFLAPLLGWPADRAHVLPLYALVLGSHGVLNHVGVRAVAVINSVSAWYHLVGVALLVGALGALAPLQSLRFLWTAVSAHTDRPYVYAFAVGLLQAQWTFTGYDASAHVTEETRDPTRNAPWGIVLSVAVSGVVGWVLVGVVTLAIPVGGLSAAVHADNPFIQVVEHALGPRLGGALVAMTVGAMWLCGLASVTSNSRMLWAFARDGGTPAATHLARVSPRFRTPHVAVWVSVAAAFVVAVWAQAYTALVALSTVALYASYALPVALGMRARNNGRWRSRGPWDLGRWSPAVNTVALAWVAVITVLFVLPPNALSGYTFAGTLAVLAVWWFGWQRKRFKGPVGLMAAQGQPLPTGAEPVAQ